MASLQLLNLQNVPAESRKNLEMLQKKHGRINNLWATLANSPVLFNSYISLQSEWEKSKLSVTEREIVFLAASVANECPYCIASYTTGLKRLGLKTDTIREIIYGEEISDVRINALEKLTKEMVKERGLVSDLARKRFTDAGFDESLILDILVGVAMKTMANYLDHIFPIPIDRDYQKEYLKVIDETHE